MERALQIVGLALALTVFPFCSTRATELGPPAQVGEDAQLGYGINAATGNLFLAQPDIHAHPGLGPDLDFVRYYNSQGQGNDVGLGPNWTHSFSWSVQVNATGAIVTADTGKILIFTVGAAPGPWVAPIGEFGTLTGKVATGLTYTTKYGVAYTFDASGRLTTIQPPVGNPITVTYSSGNQISQVTSGAGTGSLSLVFSYANGHVSSITDPAGTEWDYSYSPFDLSITSKSPLLSQGGTGLLQIVSVSYKLLPCPDPLVGCPRYVPAYLRMTLYGYVTQSVGGLTFSPGAVPAQLTGYAQVTTMDQSPGAILGRNIVETISGLFGYSNVSGFGSVVSAAASEVVAGSPLGEVSLAYAAGGGSVTTTATLNGGSKIITSSEPAPGHPRIKTILASAGVGVPGDGAVWMFAWNTDLTLKSATDSAGATTTFGPYDTRGNPLTIVEAGGRSTTFIYHPLLSSPLTMSRASVDGVAGHQHTVTWDYDCDYDQNYNTDPTLSNTVHQIVDTGYTASELTGTLNSQESHLTQIKYASAICGGNIPSSAASQIVSILGPQLPAGSPPYNPAFQYVTPATNFSYSPSGYLSQAQRVVGNGTSITTNFSAYDPDGRLTQLTDPNGSVKKTTYDSLGLVFSTEVNSADGSQKSVDVYGHDLAGNLTTHTWPEGSATQIEYDTGLRPWRVSGVGADGKAIWSRVSDFDPFGRPVAVRNFAGVGPDEGPGCTTAGTEQTCAELAYDSFERLHTFHTLDPSNNVCGGAGVLLNCTTYYAYRQER